MEENRRLTDKIALRLPDGMRERLAAMAERNNRSTNAEIVARLEKSLAEDGDVIEQRLAELERKVGDLSQAFINYLVEGNADDLLKSLRQAVGK